MNWKIVVGLILMTPLAIASVFSVVFRFDNPSLTETQAAIETAPWFLMSLVPAMAGAVLFMHGKEDYDGDSE